MSRGAFALFAETSSRTIDAVSSFSRTLAVPLVTPSAPVPPPAGERSRHSEGDDAAVHGVPRVPTEATSYVMFMRPSYQQALADVILHYKWLRVYYVYDNSEGRLPNIGPK